MAKRPISTLKKWFETNDEPTQQQFYDWFDSYFHKDEGLLVVSIEELVGGQVRLVLSDGQAFLANKELEDSRVLVIADYLTWKKPGNIVLTTHQVGDYVEGWFSATKRIKAYYLGGDIAVWESWDVVKEENF